MDLPDFSEAVVPPATDPHLGDPLLEGLNEPQKQAVLHDSGPALVFASAGSGKTGALTRRVAYLVKRRGVNPGRILVVTFTNRASGELRERIERFVGPAAAKQVRAGTFHAICAQLLRLHPEIAGRTKTFVIYSEDEQTSVMKGVLGEVEDAYAARQIMLPDDVTDVNKLLEAIERKKRDGMAPENLHPDEDDAANVAFKVIWSAYEEQLRKLDAFDFADLIVWGMRLATEDSERGAKVRAMQDYVMVDEFQDTDQTQLKLVSALSQSKRNLLVVGDDDQCHTSVTNIMDGQGESYSVERMWEQQTNDASADVIVMGCDPTTGRKTVGRKATLSRRWYEGRVYRLTVKKDGASLNDTEFVEVTPEHRMIVRWQGDEALPPFLSRAENVTRNMEVPVIRALSHESDDVCQWAKVRTITSRLHDGWVYSMNVEKDGAYFANGIGVHNSIYSWRGADSKLIRSFDKLYPDAKVIKLEQNYRSHSNIVEGAASVIGKVVDRAPKRMFSKHPPGAKIRLIEAHDEKDEGQYIAEQILALHKQGTPLKHCFVLFRLNQLSRGVEMELRARDIRYRVVGGLKFFQRAIIKDALAYARLIYKPNSDIDFVRLLDTPPCGVGDGTVSRLRRFAASRDLSLFESLEHVGRLNEVREKEKMALADLRSRIQAIRTGARDVAVKDLVQFITAKSGIDKWLGGQLEIHKHQKPNKKKAEDFQAKIDNLREMVTDAARWQQRREDEGLDATLGDYLDRVALLSSDEETSDRDAVTLMSIHGVKGLEAPHVFVIGCEEGLLPAYPEKKSKADIDEETRLMYVAMTRAEKNLHLLYARERWTMGKQAVNRPSRFLADIPEELIEFTKRRKPLV